MKRQRHENGEGGGAGGSAGGGEGGGAGDGAPSLRLVGGEPAGGWREASRQAGVSSAGAVGVRRPAPGPRARRPVSTASRQTAAPGAAAPERPHGPVAARVAQTLAASDPRWVLAIRAAESMEGTTLSPEKRRSLIRMGKVFGLTAFDANLIIAIVQDQARRGYRPEVCPRMGEAQLRMVPLPRRAKLLSLGATPARRWTTIALLIAAMAAVELVVLWVVFGA